MWKNIEKQLITSKLRHDFFSLPLLILLLSFHRFRHTWASEALLCGIPIAVISQALGHTSENTTRIYLKQLNQSVMNEANSMITKSVGDLLVKVA